MLGCLIGFHQYRMSCFDGGNTFDLSCTKCGKTKTAEMGADSEFSPALGKHFVSLRRVSEAWMGTSPVPESVPALQSLEPYRDERVGDWSREAQNPGTFDGGAASARAR